jgi:uncharacterized protein YkwD
MRWRWVLLGLVMLLVIALASPAFIANPNTTAASNEDAADRLAHLTNRARIDRGIAPLDRRAGLDAFALDEAWRIFRLRSLVHSSDGPCFYWGENIGVTPFGVKSLQEGFMDSSSHRANILNPRFHRFGVAVIDGTYLWAVVEFCG